MAQPIDMKGQSLPPGTQTLIEKLSGRALDYEELANKAANVPGMELVAEQYRAHANRFRTAIDDLRSGRTLQAAGASHSKSPRAKTDPNADATRRAAERRKRMLEAQK